MAEQYDQDAADAARELYTDLSVEQRRCFISLLTQQYVLSFPYYSAILLSAARSATPGAANYTIAQGLNTFRAFSYAYDTGNANTAGFPAGMIASRAETNLGNPNTTNAGDTVEISGIAIQPIPSFPRLTDPVGYVQDMLSDARFLAVCSGAVSIRLALNAGREGYDMGIVPMIPGAGGLEGAGLDNLGAQAIQGGRLDFGFATNGRAQSNNYFEMPEGVVWMPQGKRDSMLNVTFTINRNIIAYTGGDLANNATQGADVPPAGGIRGYVYPAIVGAALMVHLKGRTIGPRTMVS